MLNKGLYSSNKADWSTPQELFDSLDREFFFILDACANEENSKCTCFYDEEQDGLSKPWVGTVWMNPPYGRGIDKWVEKAYTESRKEGCICVCLLPVRSDTRWWHRFVMRSSEIRLLTRRLSFEHSNNKAPFPAAIVVFRSEVVTPVLKSMEV